MVLMLENISSLSLNIDLSPPLIVASFLVLPSGRIWTVLYPPFSFLFLLLLFN